MEQLTIQNVDLVDMARVSIPSSDMIINFKDKDAGAIANAHSLEEEAAIIKFKFFDTEQKNQNLIELHTSYWYDLGEMLIIHQDHVIQHGHTWTFWAVEQFPFLKKKRREQCMELANFGPRIKPYFYMGIDRIYDFFHKLQDYQTDPDFIYIAKKFGLFFKIEPQTDEERAENNKKADMIRDFFKFKGNINHSDYDNDLVISVIETGESFSKKDYDEINDAKTSYEIRIFLMQMIATASSPLNKKTVHRSNESIHVILAKLIQTIDDYISSGILPQYLETDKIVDAIDRLNALNQRLSR